MEEKVIKFRNKKGSRIEIIYFEDDVTILVSWKGNRRHWRYEDMPITRCCLVATFWDYERILNVVLRDDKVARKWFKRAVGNIIIDEKGLKIKDFVCSSTGKIDYDKLKEHDNKELGL